MHPRLPLKPLLIAVLFLFATIACNHFISPFDQHAYEQTTSLKIDVINLIDKSTEAYTEHRAEAEKVMSDVMKVVEYEKHRPKNDLTVRMWNHMIDSTMQNGIIGRYLANWKSSGPQSETFINEVKPQISRGFDLIADLESKKIKASDERINNFVTP